MLLYKFKSKAQKIVWPTRRKFEWLEQRENKGLKNIERPNTKLVLEEKKTVDIQVKIIFGE